MRSFNWGLRQVKGAIGQGTWDSVGPSGVALAEQVEWGVSKDLCAFVLSAGNPTRLADSSPSLFQEALPLLCVTAGNTAASQHPFSGLQTPSVS